MRLDFVDRVKLHRVMDRKVEIPIRMKSCQYASQFYYSKTLSVQPTGNALMSSRFKELAVIAPLQKDCIISSRVMHKFTEILS